jgi:hypothetical protein
MTNTKQLNDTQLNLMIMVSKTSPKSKTKIKTKLTKLINKWMSMRSDLCYQYSIKQLTYTKHKQMWDEMTEYLTKLNNTKQLLN